MAQTLTAPFELRPAAQRYESEIAFFDREAEQAAQSLAPIDPLIVERFRAHARRRFNKEYRVSLLTPLAGKRLLEIGCGDGEQSVLLASLGADVTGVDISPKSIELAKERARLGGVSGRARFVCAPLTHADLEEDQFDAVWGDGILHHVIPDLDAVLERIVAWSRRGARIVFTEPVNLSAGLRKLRFMLPVPVNGTPDERPLEAAELEIVGRHLAGMRIKPYLFFARVMKFVVGSKSYERSSFWNRLVTNALLAADAGVLAVPAMQRFAGQLVIYGAVAK